MTAFKNKLLAETSGARDDESRDLDEDEEENSFHSAEEPSSSTHNESESDSEDEDCKKLLEITREIDHVTDSHRQYTPKSFHI